MERLIFAFTASVLLSACAASGTQVKESQLSQFSVGKTTPMEVIQALGSPQNQVLTPDGSRMLIYSYTQVQTRPETFIPFVGAFVGGADLRTNTAMLMFGRDGLLKSVSASTGATGTGTGFASGVLAPDRVANQPRQAE